MDWRTSPYGFSLLVTAALSTSIFWYAYKRRKVPGAIPFALMMLAVTEWSLTYALELGSMGAAIKFFMLKTEFIGILIIPTAWLLFSLQYTGHGDWITPRTLFILSILPLAILLLVWTNEAHHLVWRSIRLETLGAFSVLETDRGGVFWFHTIYAYGLILFSTYLILQAFLHSPSIYRRQSGIILIGAILPWLGNILHMVNESAFMALDITPFAFTATGVAVAWGALRYGFLDIAPVARDRIFESLSDGVIVIDIRDRILDVNPIACQILELSEAELIGQSIMKAFAGWSKQLSLEKANFIEGFINQTEASEEVSFGVGGEQSDFELHISPLTDRRGRVIGRLINFRDISEQKRVEDALRLSEESYRQSVDKSPNPILSVDRDGFIQSWNPACEKVFLYDQHIMGQHYSVLLHRNEERAAVRDSVAYVFEQKQSLNELELTYRRKDGSLRFMVSRLYPIVDREGNVQRCIIANTDITERQQAEELLRKQLNELSVLHAAASACVEATDEDHLFERITQIVGDTLYPDNFGVLLLDEDSETLHFHRSYRGLPDELKSKTFQLPDGITGRVAASGQPCRVADVDQNPAYVRLHFTARSELCVPIKIGDQVMGVFNVESVQLDAFSEADERLLRILAGQLAIAVDRLRTEVAERRRARELAAISQISRDITSVLDLQGVLDSIVRHAAEFSNTDACGVFSYQPEGNLKLVAEYGANVEFVHVLKEQGVPVEGSALGRAIEERHPIQITDILEDAGYAMHDLAAFGHVRAMMALPMLRGDEVIGGIVLWHRQPRRFSLEEEVFLQALAQQSINAVENARLFESEREQRKMAEALHEIGTALSATLDVDMILDLLLIQVERIVPYDSAAVMLLEDGIARIIRARGFERFGEEIAQQVKTLSFDIQKTGNLKQLVEKGYPMLIPDISIYPGWDNDSLRLETHSWIGTPIKDQGKVTAMFSLDKNEVNFYRPEHVERLAIFAGQAGLALQNARLFDETQHRLHEVALLGRVIALTASAYDLKSALNQVCTEVAKYFEVPQAGFAMLNPEQTAAEVIAEYRGPGRSSGLGLYIPVPGNPSMIYVLEHKIPLAITDAQNDSLLAPIHEMMRQRGVASILLVPILLGEQVVGTLGIDSLEKREFSQADIELMQKVATQLGSAVERLNLLVKTQEQAHQVQQIVDTVPEGVLLLGREMQILVANPAARQILSELGSGVDGKEISGIGEYLAYLAGQPVADILKSEAAWTELEVEGSRRSVFEVAAQPLNSLGEEEGWVLVLRDITQERETLTRIQMQERLATVGQLAAGIAHDFNNIMAAIVVYTDLLMLEPHLSSASHERLGIIQQQVQRAASLIRQILDFSRRAVLEHSRLDLLPFIKELDKMLARVLPENIRLELKYQTGEYMVNADPTRLQQVFMNLALNARDAMPSGGTLHFELDRVYLRPGVSSPLPDLSAGYWICIKVVDTGIGITPEVLPHIFEPFFTTKPVGKGTGLGLAQVYGIVKQHGGSIDVSSRVGEGTTFNIYLPALDIFTNEPEEGDLTADNLKGAGETILLVEDDEAARNALQAMLEEQNYRVLVASDGLEGIKMFEKAVEPVELVVSDVVMPEMGGFEMYRILCEKHPHIKLLFMTGHPLDEKNQELLEGGRVHWLQKPFSIVEFNRVARTLLEENC